MGGSRSSTSSSEALALARDLVVALLVLLLVEWVVRPPMDRLAAQNQDLGRAPVAGAAEPDGFYQVRFGDPAGFLAQVRERLKPVTIVFVGDSQGMVTQDRRGPPYPRLVAAELARRAPDTSVLSLHLGGANTFEQGTLLLGMLQAGIMPRVVFWSNSVYSLRKNNIRAELVPLYESLPPEQTGGANVILVGDDARPPVDSLPLPQRLLERAARWLDDRSAASAAVRFSRRELWEKARILWSSRAAVLVPRALRPRTAEQRDPSTSNLEGSARFAGQVTDVLARRGVRVVVFLGPINLAADPRPFTPHAEAIAYPALERAVHAAGGEFVSWVGLLPDSCYGTYEDGSDDAFHIRSVGHERLARELLDRLEPGLPAAGSGDERPGHAAPGPAVR